MKILLLVLLLVIPVYLSAQTIIGFADTDLRFPMLEAPAKSQLVSTWKATAWRGEKINLQLILRSDKPLNKIQVSAGSLKNGNTGYIPSANIKTGFVKYIMSDGLNKDGHGCELPAGTDSSLQADAIEYINGKAIPPHTTQPVWINIRIPENVDPGQYQGTISITGKGFKRVLVYEIIVLEHILPSPSEWKFHLDLWQNPFSISRVHNVQPWSDEHFNAMQPHMKMLADAGQKTITVSMIHDPWRGQTYDIYQTMIRWIKKKDGTWTYDYSIFDKWVEFMMKQGINKLINCYTMVPWNNKFYYYDETQEKDTVLTAKTGTPEFIAHWTPMLKSFAAHLKARQWFEKASIAMDERPLEDMLKVIELVKTIEPDFKISLAGNAHKELISEIYDYCIASAESFESAHLQFRTDESLPTTFYTCCFEGYPNTFTFSPPAESVFLGWYAANKGFNGYLRWAYNCWPRNPSQDARFNSWSSGDTYLVYPGPGSSVRFEKLIEGIQDYEKIRILKEKFASEDQTGKFQMLHRILKTFEIKNIPDSTASTLIQHARSILNSL